MIGRITSTNPFTMHTKSLSVVGKLALASALFAGAGLPSRALAEEAKAAPAPEPQDTSAGFSFSSSYSLTGKTKMKAEGNGVGKVDLQNYSFEASQKVLPQFTVGVGYEHTKIGTDTEADTKAALPDNLRSLSLKMVYFRQLNSDWSMVVMGSPEWNTAQGSVFDSDGLGFSTGVQFSKRVSPTFSYSLGLGYNSQAKGSLKVLPIAGLSWSPAPDWTLSVGFPRTGVTYRFTKELSLSLQAEGTGGSYYVKDDPLPSASGKPSLADTHLQFYDIRAGLALNYTVDKSTSLSLSVGEVLARRFDYHDRDYELKSRNMAPYFSVSANFGF